MQPKGYIVGYKQDNGNVVYISKSVDYDYYYFTTAKVMAEVFRDKMECLSAYARICNRVIKTYESCGYPIKGLFIVKQNVQPRETEIDYGNEESIVQDK